MDGSIPQVFLQSEFQDLVRQAQKLPSPKPTTRGHTPTEAELEAAEIRKKYDKSRIQSSGKPSLSRKFFGKANDTILENVHISQCISCQDIAIWVHSTLIYPEARTAPMVNPDTPSDIKADYEEAALIFIQSPRGAAALLRLCIQKLCCELGQEGKSIDKDIKALVAKGLSQKIQRALDVLRVVGNESVHPGELDMRDDSQTALKLFNVFNLIVNAMISEEKLINELYDGLPENKVKGIAERDS
ncbi:hypothetical protein OA238_c26340 [Octadecabacter arcticus 238]|uniref:DUF4145 domain-containing protein n=1 Tax=Octadecabacter arcticus 238 TaxID=391616 RepID=M9RJA4_9RHOB|nr:DUF4145 domain-containing protein [Octadecabacter arcticus]AGI72679.1 hypothetical protein OA238_c26340 [Octadecabacter arcticus 238]